MNGDTLERTDFRTLRAAGPFVDATYAAVESGARRGLVATARGALYPSAITGRSSEVGDVRAQLVGYLPVPFLRRPTIALSARTRQHVGVPSTDGFLQVGGGGATGVHAQDGRAMRVSRSTIRGRSICRPPSASTSRCSGSKTDRSSSRAWALRTRAFAFRS